MALRSLVAVLALGAARATVRLNSLFTDGMVIQCSTSYGQRPIAYGAADPGEVVQLNRSAAGSGTSAYSATADATGAWDLTMDVVPCEGGPTYELTVAGSGDGYAHVTTVRNVTA